MIKPNSENLEPLVDRYYNDLALFLIEVLGFERFDEWQDWLFGKVLDPKCKFIAIASCHSSGKTLLCAGIAIWWILTRPEAVVTITSATESQLKIAFVRTIHNLCEGSIISNWFVLNQESVRVKGIDNSIIKMRAWSASRPEAMAGVHCISPLFIMDEASGIDDVIFEAIDGSMMHPNSLQILPGNPLRKEGKLFEAFQSDIYAHRHVSAYDSSFITQDWIDYMKKKYKDQPDVVNTRVLGLFPKDNTGAFISESEIEQALDNYEHGFNIVSNKRIGGLDVGSTKDDSILTVRQGEVVIVIKKYSCDIDNLAGEVNADIDRLNLDVLYMDAQGVGNNTFIKLSKMNSKVFAVPFGKLPAENKIASTKRTLYWYRLKQWLKYGYIKPQHCRDKLMTQTASFLYFTDNIGRFALEDKKCALKRGIKSPDYTDSLTYTFVEYEKQDVDKNEEIKEIDYRSQRYLQGIS